MSAITRYRVRYYDGCNWQFFDVLAQNEAQVKAYVDEACPAGERYYDGVNIDSLQIIATAVEELPYVLYHD